ncbi:MAG TPA: hypothetical protein VMT20_27480 [Terriglobia bacterium]|nr:hypothetical protein [Terriglobia bacterium]
MRGANLKRGAYAQDMGAEPFLLQDASAETEGGECSPLKFKEFFLGVPRNVIDDKGPEMRKMDK